jgi:hydrogenase maturation protease
MTEKVAKVLLFGYGNPGRLDDGLGPAFIEAFEGRDLENVTLDADYQLTVEDAAAVAQHDVTIFIDASVNGAEPFFFEKLDPKSSATFSSHSVEAGGILGQAQE